MFFCINGEFDDRKGYFWTESSAEIEERSKARALLDEKEAGSEKGSKGKAYRRNGSYPK
ncbi:hypothetical protein [Alkalihalobacillus trypoxylicola]|uniref:hypothetical protein n=1 Tax=Alkalihalobacillus trypoxylicola TaxID=519424 RepID=UPI0012E8BBE7|nr:hypothetical protein [Alkalihalobacillus trypoxylicola]